MKQRNDVREKKRKYMKKKQFRKKRENREE